MYDRTQKVVIYIFFGTFFLVALGFFLAGISKALFASQPGKQLANAVVVSRAYTHFPGNSSSYYNLVVRYFVGGHAHQANIQCTGDMYRFHAEGSSVTVAYDPGSPDRALIPGDDPTPAWQLILGGLGAMVIGAGLFWSMLRQGKSVPTLDEAITSAEHRSLP